MLKTPEIRQKLLQNFFTRECTEGINTYIQNKVLIFCCEENLQAGLKIAADLEKLLPLLRAIMRELEIEIDAVRVAYRNVILAESYLIENTDFNHKSKCDNATQNLLLD